MDSNWSQSTLPKLEFMEPTGFKLDDVISEAVNIATAVIDHLDANSISTHIDYGGLHHALDHIADTSAQFAEYSSKVWEFYTDMVWECYNIVYPYIRVLMNYQPATFFNVVDGYRCTDVRVSKLVYGPDFIRVVIDLIKEYGEQITSI
jgi:hypothetical protein